MKIHFYLHYQTRPGQNLSIEILDNENGHKILPLNYLNDEFWYLHLDTKTTNSLIKSVVNYRYSITDNAVSPPVFKTEWGERNLEISTDEDWQVFDFWNAAGAVENVFLTQPFQQILFKNAAGKPKTSPVFSHIFKVKAPLLKPDEVPFLLGHGTALRNWDTAAPLLLSKNEGSENWEIRLDLSREDFPLAYKYGVWNSKTNRFVQFETGSNRSLFDPGAVGKTVLHDGFARLANNSWRGAGVAIPVFSLRSEKSFGVGEFTDLPLLADWAKSVGLKLIQLLPVNDTSANGTWTDSYPYAAISAFALHPQYLNLEAVAGKKHAAILKPFLKKQKAVNALEAVDYEEVMREKWAAAHLLFHAQKMDWERDENWKDYFESQKNWLFPYAVFCFLKEKHGTPDFSLWPAEHQKFDPKIVETDTEADAVGLHLFVQWHLHLQLKAAADYIHAAGLVLKGDIPIGIYRFSSDAWVAPELYKMEKQAGAPPDDFAEKGQNWGFPTYNWDKMKADGFAWWRQRFAQMSLYFDAFRIDHILGFFRIWSIPLDAVEGILGVFEPALPIQEFELRESGLSVSRLTTPFISNQILGQFFGENALAVRDHFLDRRDDGLFDLKPEFATQQQVEALDFLKMKMPPEIKQGLFDLISNVILLKNSDGTLHFRFGIEKTSSFQNLGKFQQDALRNLYNNYFYKRQDDFWQIEAMEKLPALKRSTNMLICGEDLGMVPNCVPDVMSELGILSLEIQRMPKTPGLAFFHPKDAPYLSVVTPSTHDMSIVRGWWEENRELTGRFYNEILGLPGDAPFFCEPWINRAILAQHFNSPAMWAIFQLQDLMGMDGDLRRENPNEERINVPANPKHYWRYRMHLTLEKLAGETKFNHLLESMVRQGGR